MEHHSDEYRDKKLGKKPINTSTTVPKTPHYLEDRLTAFGRSYRNMRHLGGDYPEFRKELTDHAIKTIDAQMNKKGKGKAKGRGSGETESSGGQAKGGGKGVKKGKARHQPRHRPRHRPRHHQVGHSPREPPPFSPSQHRH